MATTATKVRLNKGRCISGMDGVNVEYTIQLDGMENLYLPVKEEKNEADNTIVSISCVGGKVSAYVNPVHAIRQYNVKPLGIVESIKLEIAKNRVLEIMKSYLQEHLKDKYSDDFVDSLQVVKLECNVTMRTLGNATPDTMLHFFDMVFPDTFLHRYRKVGSKCEKGDNSVKHKKDGCYILKCYDKTKEQHDNEHHKPNPLVESNLLRVELVFLSRSLKRIYGDKRTLSDVLTKKGLEKLCREYKRVLTADISDAVRKYRDDCKDMLVGVLTEHKKGGNMVADCIMRYKEEIVDISILKKSLQEYYKIYGLPDNSSQVINYYKKKGILPQDTIKTFRAFREAAG